MTRNQRGALAVVEAAIAAIALITSDGGWLALLCAITFFLATICAFGLLSGDPGIPELGSYLE